MDEAQLILIFMAGVAAGIIGQLLTDTTLTPDFPLAPIPNGSHYSNLMLLRVFGGRLAVRGRVTISARRADEPKALSAARHMAEGTRCPGWIYS